MSQEKVCPILVAGANNFVLYCVGEQCAWFLDGYNACAITFLAKRNEEDEKDEDANPPIAF